MRDPGSDSQSLRHDRLQKGKSASRLRDTRIVPGHVATFPSQILGYPFRGKPKTLRVLESPTLKLWSVSPLYNLASDRLTRKQL